MPSIVHDPSWERRRPRSSICHHNIVPDSVSCWRRQKEIKIFPFNGSKHATRNANQQQAWTLQQKKKKKRKKSSLTFPESVAAPSPNHRYWWSSRRGTRPSHHCFSSQEQPWPLLCANLRLSLSSLCKDKQVTWNWRLEAVFGEHHHAWAHWAANKMAIDPKTHAFAVTIPQISSYSRRQGEEEVKGEALYMPVQRVSQLRRRRRARLFRWQPEDDLKLWLIQGPHRGREPPWLTLRGPPSTHHFYWQEWQFLKQSFPYFLCFCRAPKANWFC